jgi:hypothetical protein
MRERQKRLDQTVKALDVDLGDVPKPMLASAIVKISETMTALSKSGLTRRAIIVLVKDASGEPKTTIERVLSSLENLKRDYCS